MLNCTTPSCGAAGAEVAEWQTRWTQNPVPSRECGFKSHLRHTRCFADPCIPRHPWPGAAQPHWAPLPSRPGEASLVMGSLIPDQPALASCQQYQALLAVAEAIISHRDLKALFHDLADRLRQVVHFDYLILVLHDGANDTMRRHILE